MSTYDEDHIKKMDYPYYYPKRYIAYGPERYYGDVSGTFADRSGTYQDIHDGIMDRLYPLTNSPKSIPTPPPLSEKDALERLEQACESDVGYNEAIIALRKHGWTISFNPTLTCDGRGGYAITLLPKENYNAQKSQV